MQDVQLAADGTRKLVSVLTSGEGIGKKVETVIIPMLRWVRSDSCAQTPVRVRRISGIVKRPPPHFVSAPCGQTYIRPYRSTTGLVCVRAFVFCVGLVIFPCRTICKAVGTESPTILWLRSARACTCVSVGKYKQARPYTLALTAGGAFSCCACSLCVRACAANRGPQREPRYTICVSSQVGCAMNCQFCFTGRLGLMANLQAAQVCPGSLGECAKRKRRVVYHFRWGVRGYRRGQEPLCAHLRRHNPPL